MKNLLSLNVKPPTTVLKLANSVFMTGPSISLLELMRRLGSAARPRPFYLIAHAANNLAKVAEKVAEGANAIECDINYAGVGFDFKVYHDAALDDQIAIRSYLDDLVALLKVNKQVTLVYFDVKDADPIRAPDLLAIIRKHLTSVIPDINVVIGQSDYSERVFFAPVLSDVRGREGFIIDEHDNPLDVSNFFSQNGVKRFGYGDGVFRSGVPKYIPRAIMAGVALKWSQRKIRWVCTWTLAEKSSMRDYIAKGVDGIMVEDVTALKEVLNEPAFKNRVQLATRDDDAFSTPVHTSYLITVKTGSNGTDANLTFELRGSEGNLYTTIDAFPSYIFEAGNTDLVTLIGKDVGTIEALVLTQDGSSNFPDWLVEQVTVQKNEIGAPIVTFNFFATLDDGKPVMRKPA